MNFKKRVNGSWVDTPNYIHNTSTDTITTPADIYANATTATVGLKGNMYQASGVSPATPIQPSECGERTGNLCLVSQSNSITYDTFNNYTISNNTVTSTGQALLGFKCKVEPNTSYTISIKKNTSADLRIREYSSEPTDWATDFVIQSLNTNQTTAVITTTQNTTWILVTFWFSTAGHTVYDIMLNLGSEALPYEPYGIKIPISSANTTTPVYLGEVETTRRVKKLVLTGNETWYKDSSDTNRTVCYMNLTDCAGNTGYCTHIEWKSTYTPTEYNKVVYQSGTYKLLYISIANTYISDQTAEAFKEWLASEYAAGHPVTIYYILATPTTGIVNEPLRKIGDYADSVSGITIPVTAGANTLSVGTTLQPSEVTVNYKGWHPVADVHEREDGNDNYIPDLNTLTTTVSNCVIESVSNNTLVLSGNGYTGSSFSQIISNDVMMPSNLIGKTVTLSGSITWSSEGNITPRVTIMMHRSGSTDYNVSIYQGVFTQTFEVPSDATSYALLFRIDQNRSEYVGTARVTYTNIELKEQPHWT